MNINKELVKKWVEALRSGKYKQGRSALRNRDNEFCCLGVLCDISKQDLGIDWKLDDEIYYMEELGGVLPDKVWEYLGKGVTNYKVEISTTNSKIPSSLFGEGVLLKNYVYLVTLNDCYGVSFERIADIIEEEFLK